MHPKTTTKTCPPRQSPPQQPMLQPQKSPPPKWPCSPPPAAKKPTIVLYSLDVRDAAVVAYYNDKGSGYDEVKVHVNGMVPPGTSCFLLAGDGMLVSWQQAMDLRCFLKKHLHGVMHGKFSPSHSRIIAYCSAGTRAQQVDCRCRRSLLGDPSSDLPQPALHGDPPQSNLPLSHAAQDHRQ